MAISVTLDTVPATQLDVASASLGQPTRFVRTGMVEGIDVTVVSGSPKYEAMFLASQAVIAACAANPLTNHPDLILQRIILDPVSDTSTNARIIYETVVFGNGIPPSTYVITDGASLLTRQTTYLPGTRIPLVTSWSDNSAFAIAALPSIPEDYVPMSFGFPLRVMQVDALMYGRPTNGQAFIGHVNDAEWPTQTPTFPGQPSSDPIPLPRAYWRMDEFVVRNYRISGYYTLAAKATSKVIEDWSEGGTLQDTHTGKYVQIVPGDIDASNAIINVLFQRDYEYGIQYAIDPGDPTRNCGFIRVGPHPLKSFSDIFGF